jgi:hypothetical protein
MHPLLPPSVLVMARVGVTLGAQRNLGSVSNRDEQMGPTRRVRHDEPMDDQTP